MIKQKKIKISLHEECLKVIRDTTASAQLCDECYLELEKNLKKKNG